MAKSSIPQGPAPEFSIPVHDLDAGGREYAVPVRAAWLRGVLEETDVDAATRDGSVKLRLSKSGTDVVIRGSIEAEVQVACSRCLKPTPVAVHEELSLLAVPAHSSRAPHGARSRGSSGNLDEDPSPEEADILAYDGDTLVLDDLIRDELLLGIPMIPLCSDSCTGIRPKSEEPQEPDAGAAIDPRFEPLLRLKNKT